MDPCPSCTCPSPLYPLISDLNRLICIFKKIKSEKKKEQHWKEQERLSRALHKTDELLLDIRQERKSSLLFDDISLLVMHCCCA